MRWGGGGGGGGTVNIFWVVEIFSRRSEIISREFDIFWEGL